MPGTCGRHGTCGTCGTCGTSGTCGTHGRISWKTGVRHNLWGVESAKKFDLKWILKAFIIIISIIFFLFFFSLFLIFFAGTAVQSESFMLCFWPLFPGFNSALSNIFLYTHFHPPFFDRPLSRHPLRLLLNPWLTLLLVSSPLTWPILSNRLIPTS